MRQSCSHVALGMITILTPWFYINVLCDFECGFGPLRRSLVGEVALLVQGHLEAFGVILNVHGNCLTTEFEAPGCENSEAGFYIKPSMARGDIKRAPENDKNTNGNYLPQSVLYMDIHGKTPFYIYI